MLYSWCIHAFGLVAGIPRHLTSYKRLYNVNMIQCKSRQKMKTTQIRYEQMNRYYEYLKLKQGALSARRTSPTVWTIINGPKPGFSLSPRVAIPHQELCRKQIVWIDLTYSKEMNPLVQLRQKKRWGGPRAGVRSGNKYLLYRQYQFNIIMYGLHL
ncbi:Hypothetical_protein [Hexamita inflata]|uniref:Hypothetical_protein n=1 Tax=Hexamita inflata TaxID=28002 RepID=A0AA86NWW3_9EUKA|nr:Hypothetical protein HINF_LOCUS15133 [Hexamita inflata]